MSQMPVSVKRVDGGHIKGAQAVPNVLEFRCMVTGVNGKPASFTFHGHFTTPPANIQTIASAAWTSISAAWGTNIAPHCPTATTFNSVLVRDMTATTNPQFIGTGTPIPGTGGLIAMPPQNAVVITENLTMRGKGLKGRLFIGGWDTSADAGAGQISAAANTAANALGTAIQNFLTGQSLTPCVAQVHRQAYMSYTGAQHAERLATFAAVSSYTVNNLRWDTQRRRA